MRFLLTFVMFVIVGVTIAGSLMIALLIAPISGQDVQKLFAWVIGSGFALALPVSYILAGHLLKLTQDKTSG